MEYLKRFAQYGLAALALGVASPSYALRSDQGELERAVQFESGNRRQVQSLYQQSPERYVVAENDKGNDNKGNSDKGTISVEIGGGIDLGKVGHVEGKVGYKGPAPSCTGPQAEKDKKK